MCPSCRILKTKRIEWRQSVEWTPKISLSGLTRPWRRFLLPTRLNPPTKNSQTGPKFCACSKIFKAFLVFFLTFFLLVVQTKGIRFFSFSLFPHLGPASKPPLARMQLSGTQPGFDWSTKQMPPSLRKLHEWSSDFTPFHCGWPWRPCAICYYCNIACIPIRWWISIKY